MARPAAKIRGHVELTLPHQWTPRKLQAKPYNDVMSRGFKRAIWLWHRRNGKDVTGINVIVPKSQQRIGTYWHAFPEYTQARAAIWEGITRSEDEKDAGVEVWQDRQGNYHDIRPRKFIDHFPKQLIKDVNTHEMRITLHNGSIYKIVGMDSYDSLVGPNPIGIFMSEFSRGNPAAWTYWQPMLAENGGWAIFGSTPFGENHYHDLWNMAMTMPDVWSCDLQTVEQSVKMVRDKKTGQIFEVPVIGQEIIDQLRREGMSEEAIQQEFYCSFTSPMQGSYYADQMKGLLHNKKIIPGVEYDPMLPVYTAWDLGQRDATAIWFCQKAGLNQIRLIDYYQENNKPLSHYISVVRAKGYDYAVHIAPWDMSMIDHDGITRFQRALKLGIKFRVLPRTRIEDGVESVRALLPRCVFNSETCKQGIAALRSYRKEFDTKNNCYRDTPKHDWARDGADAFRYLAMGLREAPVDVVSLETNYLEEESFI